MHRYALYAQGISKSYIVSAFTAPACHILYTCAGIYSTKEYYAKTLDKYTQDIYYIYTFFRYNCKFD